MIVIPEREVPGASARTWAMPIQSAVAEVGALERATLRPAVGPVEQGAEEDQLDRDHPGLAEVFVDEVGGEAAGDHRRDRADRDRHGEALVVGLDRPLAQRAEEADDQAPDLEPEVGDRGDQGAGVEGDVEGLVEGVVFGQEGVVLQPGDDDQVA